MICKQANDGLLRSVTQLHIFVIPSWVGGAADPMAGIFTLEQAQAIARLHPDWTVTFSAVNCHYLSRHLFTVGRLLSVLGKRRIGRAGAAPANFRHRPGHVLVGMRALRNATTAPLLAAHRRRLVQAAQRETPDILHAHVAWPAGAVARELSREFGIPYIVTEHMGPFPLPTPPYADATGRASRAMLEPLEHADAVVAVGARLATEMREQGLRREIRIIPNLVDTGLFHPAAAARPRDRAFTFLAVSRLTEEKGIGDLLDAIRDFRRTGAEARFRIIGSGPVAPYRRRAAELGIADLVSFPGHLDRTGLAAEMRMADALVAPSRRESFGSVLIEAMASGIPVLATRSGGPEGIVTAGTGLLVPVADPSALACGMVEMMARHGDFEPRTLVAECRARYGADTVGAQIAELYREVLARRAGTAS